MPAEDLAEEYERRHKEQARRQKMQVMLCTLILAYLRGFYDSCCHLIAIPVVVVVVVRLYHDSSSFPFYQN